MCGRFARYSDPDELLRPLGLSWQGPPLPPSYNVAPSQPVLAVRRREDRHEAVLLRWGLIPPWAKDKSIGYRMINARAEGLADKPAFRQPFRHQRCLIPADGFYEWQRKGRHKQPWYIHRANGEPLAFAGLWAHWQGGAEIIESCAIITGPPNAVVAPIHDRMPVILEPADHAAWLESDNPLWLQQLLRPLPAELLEAYPVGLAVNDPSHDGSRLIEPHAEPG